MKKTAILLIFVMIISLIPALNVSAEGEEYFLKGLYEGATVVIQQEPTKTVTLVDKDYAAAISDVATDVSKVVFTFNSAETTVTSAPFSYTMEFTYAGTQTLRYDVYNADDIIESKTITFNAVAGAVNDASFTEDFEGTFADTAALAKAIIANDGKNYGSTYLPLVTKTHNGSTVLSLDSDPYAVNLQFRGAEATTGHKVHYYEFDLATGYSYRHCFYVRGDGYSSGSNQVELLNPQVKINNNWFFTGVNKIVKVGIVLDYNEASTATIYLDGKELKRLSLEDALAGSSEPVLALWIHQLGTEILIDNFKYFVYDIKEAPSFTHASISGGDRPVLETLSEISFTGTDYLEGQNIADFVTVSERDNSSNGDFTTSDISFTPSIEGPDVVVSFNQELAMGTTYKVSISGLQDSYRNYYNDYDFTFRTLNEGENPLPEITLTSPMADERYYPNESTVALSAEAYDTLDGEVVSVEFYADDELIGEGINTEGNIYEFDWVLDDSIDKPEAVVVTALAVDNEGGISETMPVNITIWSRQIPEITITSPEQDTVFCSNFVGVAMEVKPTIEFVTADADGTIDVINVYVDGELDGTVENPATATAYTLTNQLDLGEHTIKVEVIDDDSQNTLDEVSVDVIARGKSGYLIEEKYYDQNLLSKWDITGTATFATGSLAGYEDIKGIIISAASSGENKANRPIEKNITDTSFAADIKIAFGDTLSKRTIKLGSAELVTFAANGKITYGGVQVADLTYLPGQIYNVSAVIDAENDKVYALVDGTKVSEATATIAGDPVISIIHDGVGETAILSVNASKLGIAETPYLTLNGATQFTVNFASDADLATLKDNVLMKNTQTGKAVNLIYANGVFTINEVLKFTENYKVVVSPDVRDINGNGYSGTFEAPYITPAPSVAVAEVSGSVAGNTAILSVDFVGAAESKVVTLVCAAYKNNKMVAYGTYEFNTNTELDNYALTLTGTIEAGAVIEAFVVDGELNSVTDKILVVE